MSDDVPHLLPGLQPPSVDFIDNRLPLIHKAFTFPWIGYDRRIGRYLPKELDSADVIQQNDAALMDRDGEEPNGQPIQPDVPATMTFWNVIFDQSMGTFKSLHPKQPQGRVKDGFNYSIREKTAWEQVYAQLEKALERYVGGRYKRYRRLVGDHVTRVAKLGVKVAPSSDITTPILGAVQIILDAFETSAEVREKMTTSVGQDELERRFRCIETFLSAFPEDADVRKASIALVVSIFKAVEDAIGFFLMNDFSKSFSAVLNGKKYQKKPLDSISGVQTSCDSLIECAQNSHIADTKKSMNTILEGTAKTQRKIDIMTELVNDVLERLEHISQQQESQASRANKMQEFLEDGVKLHFRELKKRDKEIRSQDKEIRSLKAEVRGLKLERERSRSPDSRSLQESSPRPLPYQMPILMATPHMLSRQSQNVVFLPAHTSGTFAWPPASYQGQQHLGEPVPTIHIQPQPALPIATSRLALLDLLNVPPDLDKMGQASINASESLHIPLREQRKADLLLSSAKFRYWIVSPRSSELLVHGEFKSGGAWREASALSHFCAAFVRAMAATKTYLPLVHFCGSHIEGDDRLKGAGGMMRSLLAQLLQRGPLDDAVLEEPDADLDQISKGRLPALCKLLVWLVHRLPEEVVVVCVIDGISHYETDEFEEDMLEALDCLLRLARNKRVDASVKLLVTSPTTTDSVQDRFCEKDDDCFISLAELRDTLHASNSELLEEDSDDQGQSTDSDRYDGSEVEDEEDDDDDEY